MGKKIFVSYKYADNQVKNFPGEVNTTVRDYVDKFEKKLDLSDNIYKGESDGEDLSKLTEDVIWEKIRNRIFDSSVTILFISPGMREYGVKDGEQWIPWEIEYSLKDSSRKDKNGNSITSHTNAMLAVVLPDRTGSYDYYLEEKKCCERGCVMHHTNLLFTIVKKNKFNRIKNEKKWTCDNHSSIWSGTCSYIEAVKWQSFIEDYQFYVNAAVNRQENIKEYKICKEK